ncbi:nucleotide sugar dehydrogenase [Aeromicrobium phragmitis]|uniref:Nucleotide sugar dehydrogenase n=1 Tax=Aeromicrobium phragmitis TaxID=2478914 RepID=A0A3L8PKG4_9ACTN|nr:nucleotide sugar dehydrogenase [Aeromicrobium phragmitis]RLV55684.1 nucleotide sugar dehydrogenase [Aeromicrobium phragmitis]
MSTLDLPDPRPERSVPSPVGRIEHPRATEPAVTADVAIAGLGYVGLPTALAYHHAGQRVVAFDISPHRRAAIERNDVDLLPSDRQRLHRALDDAQFRLVDDPAQLRCARAVIVCVPTPVDRHLVPDLTALRAACETLVEYAVPGQLLMLTSTTYVGCTEDLLVRPLRRRGLVAGEDIHVAFSAERIDPGSAAVRTEQVPRVVAGATSACTGVARRVLAAYAERVHPVPSLAVAEMTKLLENTFRAVNIALVNEFADICGSLGLEVTDVIDAAATKPYGFMPFRPGPGVGGHCIPCDPHYLLWQLRKDRVDAPMISTAMQQIAARPTRVVERLRDVLSRHGLGMPGARVLVSGVTYKPDVADLRESPALEILQRLIEAGAVVGFTDPYVSTATLPNGIDLLRVDDPAAFAPDLVLLHTAHSGTDATWIPDATLVVDGTYGAQALPNRVTL